MTGLRTPYSCLVSYVYFHDVEGEAVLREMARAGAAVIGDSGAFSALAQGTRIDLEDYARWIIDHRADLVWAASLDVIGDPASSWRNWRQLTALGVTTMPTIHIGTPPTELDRYADAGCTFVGLGGIAARAKSRSVATLRWLVSVFRYARDHHPAMRFHGWGVGGTFLLDPLPFFSTDTTTFASGYRYGAARLFDRHTARIWEIQLDGFSAGRHGRWLRAEYGVNPRDVARSYAGNRQLIQRMAFTAAQRMEDHYRARHHVSAPPEQAHRSHGTHIHYADSAPDTYRILIKLLDASSLEESA
jgi:hypothetical protein